MNNLIGKFNLFLLTERCLSTNTILAYIRDLDQFNSFIQKNNLKKETLGLKELRLFLGSIAHLSASTRARKISTLKTFYNFLELHQDMANLARQLMMPQLDERLPYYLSEREVKELLMHAQQSDNVRNQLLVALLYATGGRISEIIKIKVRNIMLDSRLVTLKGKRNKDRVIPLPKCVVKIIKNYLKKEHLPSSYLFSVRYGDKINAMSRQNASVILNAIWKKTGIDKKIWPHQLRHSYATHMLKRGANLRQLQTLLGHERVSSVEVYTHLDNDHIRKEYDKKHPRA